MPGATAYFGLKDAASFKKGDIVLVSGAAGAVGSAVGQLAKLWGAKQVIGTAGGPDKCKLVVDKYGFDACIDYKKFDTEEKMTAELKRLCPDGLDVHFDNVGGHVSDSFLNLVRKHGRVAVCGSISQYNDAKPPLCPSPWVKVIYTSVRIQGFLVYDYHEHWQEFLDEVHPLVKQNKIQYEETVVEGFEKLPEALNGLFKGANVGKMVVKI
jgi:NADPH-dependent curcumin reductase CurA